MKKIHLFLLPLLMISISILVNAQPPEDFIVTNKSDCAVKVHVYCTNGGGGYSNLGPNGYFYGSCSSNSAVCYISVDFDDGSLGPEVIQANPLVPPCLYPGDLNIGTTCLYNDIDWANISGYTTMNIRY